jgi:hypothetical protein
MPEESLGSEPKTEYWSCIRIPTVDKSRFPMLICFNKKYLQIKKVCPDYAEKIGLVN